MAVNYRKYYEKCLDIKIPKGFVIHHIDFDRNNNDISNLLMLPKDLHEEYHKVLGELRCFNSGQFDGKINIHYQNIVSILEKFIPIYNKCWEYNLLKSETLQSKMNKDISKLWGGTK